MVSRGFVVGECVEVRPILIFVGPTCRLRRCVEDWQRGLGLGDVVRQGGVVVGCRSARRLVDLVLRAAPTCAGLDPAFSSPEATTILEPGGTGPSGRRGSCQKSENLPARLRASGIVVRRSWARA